MDYRTMFGSKNFLGAADLQGREPTVTVEAVAVEAIDGDKGPEQKLVVRFRGASKRLILNKTNAETLAALSNSADTDTWIGRTVVLFTEPTVWKGTLTQGLRLRAATAAVPAAAVPVQPTVFAPTPPSTTPLGSPVLDADDPPPF